MKKCMMLLLLLFALLSIESVYALEDEPEVGLSDTPIVLETPVELEEQPIDLEEPVVGETIDEEDEEKPNEPVEMITATVFCNDIDGNAITVKEVEFVKGTNYTVPELELDDFDFVRFEGSNEGEALEDFEITAIYKRQMGSVVVSYVDEEEKELEEDTTITKEVGEPYQVEAKEIKNYEVKEVKGKEKGTIKKETTRVKYVYTNAKIEEKKDVKGAVVISYKDAFGNKLSGNVTLRGYAGTSYEAYVKDIKGYKVARIEGEEKGTFSTGTKYVVYTYEATSLGVGSTGRVIRTNKQASTSKDAIPNTGINDYSSYLAIGSSVIFGILLLIKKRVLQI